MFLFMVFSLIAIVAAVGVIISRRPIYSALFLLTNFASLAALYVMLQAQFLAAVQVIVYAGAIVVLFLFVVMLLGGGELNDIRDPSRPFAKRFGWQRVVAVMLALLLLAGVGYGIVSGQLHPQRATRPRSAWAASRRSARSSTRTISCRSSWRPCCCSSA